MIFLLIFAMTAMADEPEDKSPSIYQNYCVYCHGERLEKIPLKEETTAEERVKIVNKGIGGMPPYAWILSEGDAERLVKYMEGIK